MTFWEQETCRFWLLVLIFVLLLLTTVSDLQQTLNKLLPKWNCFIQRTMNKVITLEGERTDFSLLVFWKGWNISHDTNNPSLSSLPSFLTFSTCVLTSPFQSLDPLSQRMPMSGISKSPNLYLTILRYKKKTQNKLIIKIRTHFFPDSTWSPSCTAALVW